MTQNPPTDEEIREKIRQRQEEAGQEEDTIPFLSAWPRLKPEAMGPQWVQEFVNAATEFSEADPAAVLFTFLPRFAAEVGNTPFLRVGDAKHPAILFSAIVGATGKSRKGTSAAPVRRLESMNLIEHNGYVPASVTPGPLSSGEGLIERIKDATMKWDPQACAMIVSDPGVEDKRLFVLSEELASAFKVMQRDGNNLSPTLRCYWDGKSMAPITKNNPIRVTDPHVCITGHITNEELLRVLDEGEHFTGLTNRFLWVCAKRGPLQPLPKGIHDNDLARFQKEYLRCAVFAQTMGEVFRTKRADDRWIDAYPELTKDHPGILGSVCNRAEAQTARLSLIFALLCGAKEIDVHHIDWALAAWEYTMRSAGWIFNVATEDPVKEKILGLLEEKGKASLTEIHKALGNNHPKEKIQDAIKSLESMGLISVEEVKTAGRPKQIISLTKKAK